MIRRNSHLAFLWKWFWLRCINFEDILYRKIHFLWSFHLEFSWNSIQQVKFLVYLNSYRFSNVFSPQNMWSIWCLEGHSRLYPWFSSQLKRSLMNFWSLRLETDLLVTVLLIGCNNGNCPPYCLTLDIRCYSEGVIYNIILI